MSSSQNARTEEICPGCDATWQTEADRYREALREAQRRLEWIVRDRREPDKVLLNVASTGRVIQRALDEGGSDA